MSEYINVGLGEIKVSRDPDDVLVAYGLGSCLGIGMYDPITRVAGLLHAVLPTHPNGHSEKNPRYVDTGILGLITELTKLGAKPEKFIVRMAGGANMLVAPGFSPTLNIGSRNVDTAYSVFSSLKMRLSSEEVGGTTGRTVRFYVNGGRMTIRTVGNQEREI